MTDDAIYNDPAFPAMTLDILNNMLSRSDNPGRLAKYLTEEIRELTGARSVLLIQCLETSHTVIDVNPARHRDWARSQQAQHLFEAAHKATGVQLWRIKTHPEIGPLLPSSSFKISIVIPLQVGKKAVGAMLLLGLPDEQHIKTVIELLTTLSGVLALMLRNALLYEDQERAIEKRTKELKFYGVTTENMNDPVFWINPDSSFKKINLSARRMLGYSDQELSGLCLTDIIADLSRENWSDHWDTLKQVDSSNFETVLLTRNNEEVPVDLSANYFEFEDNAYNCIIARDLTERKKLEARLQQAQKMEAIGTLAGGIAHDFNNILFPIIGFTEMLKDDIPYAGSEQEHLDEILQAALRAKDLVQQILTFSRQGDKEFKPVKIQLIIKEALKLLRSSIPRTIDIQAAIDPDCGVVVADPTQIHQIMMNLATNAYHAMQESGGVLKVSLKQVEIGSPLMGFSHLISGDYAMITVIDTGTGIKKEIIDKIFDPYFSTKKRGEGTGLGLSVVQGIVKSFNGDIHIYSEPGKGTQINIYLPIKKKTVFPGESGTPDPIQTGRERLLVVDDEEPIIRLQQMMLERLGYTVTPVTDSVEALKIFKADPEQFDLVISDMTMPNMTGDQLAMQIIAVKPDIPIVICTGFSEKINKEKAHEIGIKDILIKPIVKHEMAKIIRKLLDEPRKSS